MKKLIIKSFVGFLLFFSLMGSAHSKFMNLKIDTLSMLVGATDVELDFYLGKVSVGPAVYALDLELLSWKYEANLVGGQASFHLDGADSDGWMLTGKYLKGKFKFTYTSGGVAYSAEPDVSIIYGYFGYQWMWDNFNIQLKYGQSKYDTDANLTLTASDGSTLSKDLGSYSGTSASFEFRFGLAF